MNLITEDSLVESRKYALFCVFFHTHSNTNDLQPKGLIILHVIILVGLSILRSCLVKYIFISTLNVWRCLLLTTRHIDIIACFSPPYT